MIKPDLIIFDCDGVLVDSEVLSCRCLSEVLAGTESSSVWIRRSICSLDEASRWCWSTTRDRDSDSGAIFHRADGKGPRGISIGARPRRRGRRRAGGPAGPHLRRLVQRFRPRLLFACIDRSRVAFRHAALYVADGETRQAGARSLSLRGRKDAGGSRAHPGDRGQRQRRAAPARLPA